MFKICDTVKAFHPRTLGVVHTGTVREIIVKGNKTFVQVRFLVDGRKYVLPFNHVYWPDYTQPDNPVHSKGTDSIKS